MFNLKHINKRQYNYAMSCLPNFNKIELIADKFYDQIYNDKITFDRLHEFDLIDVKNIKIIKFLHDKTSDEICIDGLDYTICNGDITYSRNRMETLICYYDEYFVSPIFLCTLCVKLGDPHKIGQFGRFENCPICQLHNMTKEPLEYEEYDKKQYIKERDALVTFKDEYFDKKFCDLLSETSSMKNDDDDDDIDDDYYAVYYSDSDSE